MDDRHGVSGPRAWGNSRSRRTRSAGHYLSHARDRLLLDRDVVAVATSPQRPQIRQSGSKDDALGRAATAAGSNLAPTEERGMRMRLAICLASAIGLVMASAPRVFAHGEAADEPFLKDLTVAFYDVNIAPAAVKVGEPVTITGSLKVLETWPYTLDPPQTAYLTPVVPGPVFALTERTVNGDPDVRFDFYREGRNLQFQDGDAGAQSGSLARPSGYRYPGHRHADRTRRMGYRRAEWQAFSPGRHAAQRPDGRSRTLRRQVCMVVVVRRIPHRCRVDALLDRAEANGDAPRRDVADPDQR